MEGTDSSDSRARHLAEQKAQRSRFWMLIESFVSLVMKTRELDGGRKRLRRVLYYAYKRFCHFPPPPPPPKSNNSIESYRVYDLLLLLLLQADRHFRKNLFFFNQGVSKRWDLVKISKVIFQIKRIPFHLWWDCKKKIQISYFRMEPFI